MIIRCVTPLEFVALVTLIFGGLLAFLIARHRAARGQKISLLIGALWGGWVGVAAALLVRGSAGIGELSGIYVGGVALCAPSAFIGRWLGYRKRIRTLRRGVDK